MNLLKLETLESKRAFLGGLAASVIQYFAQNMKMEAIILSVMVILLILDTVWGVYGAINNKEFNGKILIKGVVEKLVMYVTLVAIAHLSNVMAGLINAPVVSYLAPFIYGTMFAYEAQSVFRNIAKSRRQKTGLIKRVLKYFDEFDDNGNHKTEYNEQNT